MADGMVMVGCKAPNGVVLNLDRYEIVGGGAARVIPGKQTVTLKGWAHEFNRIDPAAETGGYVLTSVPQSFWDEWLKTHPDFPMLEDKTIIGPHKDVVGQARDMAAVPKMHTMPERQATEISRSALSLRD